jgi:hypothetical protein
MIWASDVLPKPGGAPIGDVLTADLVSEICGAQRTT